MLKHLKARSSIRDRDQELGESKQWFHISPQSSGVNNHPQPLKIRTLSRELKDRGEKLLEIFGEKKKIHTYDQKAPQPTQSTYGQTTDLQFQTTFPPESSTYYLIWSSLRESPERLCFERTSQALLWALLSTEGFRCSGMGVKSWQSNGVFMHSPLFWWWVFFFFLHTAVPLIFWQDYLYQVTRLCSLCQIKVAIPNTDTHCYWPTTHKH